MCAVAYSHCPGGRPFTTAIAVGSDMVKVTCACTAPHDCLDELLPMMFMKSKAGPGSGFTAGCCTSC